jgi:hypothetical protein
MSELKELLVFGLVIFVVSFSVSFAMTYGAISLLCALK